MSVQEHPSHEHLSDDVLIDGLYGLADVEAPVRECAMCAARWNELRDKRAAMAVPVEAGPGVFAAQRRNIYRAIEHPLRLWEQAARMRWAGPTVATAAAVFLFAIGVFVHRPGTPALRAPAVVPAAIDNTQLSSDAYSDVYSDVYSMEQSFEPSATASIRVLFEADGSAVDGAKGAKQ